MNRSRERYRLDYRCYRAMRDMLFMGYMGRRKTYASLAFDGVELAEHIGGLLQPGMEWSGYGTVWNIDHIRALSTFVYETDQDEAFKECWSLANLRPMLVTHNRSKGPRRDGDWAFIE